MTGSPREDMERVLSHRLRLLDDARRLVEVRSMVARMGGGFEPEICTLLLDAVELAADRQAVEGWATGLPDTANGAWLQAQLLADPAGAAHAWERFFALQSGRRPLDLLACARALAGAGAHPDAILKLRLAMAREAPHGFFARSESLVRELLPAMSAARQCRIAVLGSSTTSLLVPVLRALCLRDRIRADIYEAPYGSMEHEIRDPAGGLARFRPDVVLLLMHWRDLRLDEVAGDERAWLECRLDERKTAWRLLAVSGCHILQTAFDFPAGDSYGDLSGRLSGGRRRLIELLNLRLREEAPGNVSILDMAAVQRAIGSGWEDEAAWARYRQHPGTEALPALAEACLAHLRAVLGLARKVLVTDLDNTLWRGVIGEDGLDGIGVGPGTPEGEAHLELQRYLRQLNGRGVLLAVCSKNNPEDARLPFLKHPQMALRLEHFAAFRANWEDKVSNLRELARELSLGLDSFVFLDDNPLEREWVRSQLPEVAVVETGPSIFHFVRQLDRARYFEAVSLSREDLARADQYRVEAQRENLRSAAASLDDFLRSLQLEASVERVAGRNLARVAQLVNKTNQFNLTTRRYTEEQIRAIAEDPHAWAAAFQMSDRMGSYGLIGVMFCRPAGAQDTWEIDSWLMSCRTLGRQMEKFMFDRLLESAIQRRIRRIVGVYRPTPKNGLVRELYDQMGFRRVDESAGGVRYELEVPEQLPATATHVRNAAAPAMREQP